MIGCLDLPRPVTSSNFTTEPSYVFCQESYNYLQSSQVEEHGDTEGEEVDDGQGLEHEDA